jgi:hypothetical protein
MTTYRPQRQIQRHFQTSSLVIPEIKSDCNISSEQRDLENEVAMPLAKEIVELNHRKTISY